MKTPLWFILLFVCISPIKAQALIEKPNILFIVVDDLNDYIGTYGGHPQVKTPNIDSLATRGVKFTNAFCNSTVCAASRSSFLSGKDVLYTQVYENKTYLDYFRDNFNALKGNEEVITLPEHLKNNGYYTYGINKIFHSYFFEDEDETTDDTCLKNLSWSRTTVFNETPTIDDETTLAFEGLNAFKFGDLDNDLEPELMDYRAIDEAITFINGVADGSEDICENPFFLAVGIAKPHLDLFIPRQYFFDDYINDFYDMDYNIPYNQPCNAWPANGLIMPPQPEILWGDFDSLGRVAEDMSLQDKNIHAQFISWGEDILPIPLINDTLSDDERTFILQESKRANAIMAYIAAVQYVDEQVGRLINALDAQPELAENTVIVFISDHGFSLGEKEHWRKSALWETDIRVPFIIVDPNKPGNKICNRTVSLLDIYPTLCEIASIEQPLFTDGSIYLDGENLTPLINNPVKKWERPVLSTIKLVNNLDGACFPQYSVRSEKFHYIKYATNNDGTYPTAFCSETLSETEEELYEIGANREIDPNEWNNLANNDDYIPVKDYLREFLPDGALYMQQAHIVTISNGTTACFLFNTGKINLKARLYSPTGAVISGALLANYQFKWTNNLTGEIYYGTTYPFLLSGISAADFAINEKLLFNISVLDIATGKIIAFETKTFYINPANTPEVDFHVPLLDDIVSISDYSISGSYTNTKWDFGDGFITEDFLPAPHTYAAPGIYTIKNYVYYGNNCSMIISNSVLVTDILKQTPDTRSKVILFPNPANESISINFDLHINDISITIINTLGQQMEFIKYNINNDQMQLDIKNLPAGTYIIKIQSAEFNENKIFEIVR